MMKRIPFVFAAALLMAALLYQPMAVAQGGADNVDASIDAILNRSAPAPQPVSAPARAVAAAEDAATAVEARTVEAETAVAEAPAVAEILEAPAEVPAAEPVVEVVAAEAVVEAVAAAPAPAMEAPASAPAANEDGEVLVSMEFDEAPLPDVIRAFREASGATIISRWTNAAPQLVSLRLENKPWKQGLIQILEPYGLQLTEKHRDVRTQAPQVGRRAEALPVHDGRRQQPHRGVSLRQRRRREGDRRAAPGMREDARSPRQALAPGLHRGPLRPAQLLRQQAARHEVGLAEGLGRRIQQHQGRASVHRWRRRRLRRQDAQ
jgi:hypothetical protein